MAACSLPPQSSQFPNTPPCATPTVALAASYFPTFAQSRECAFRSSRSIRPPDLASRDQQTSPTAPPATPASPRTHLFLGWANQHSDSKKRTPQKLG